MDALEHPLCRPAGSAPQDPRPPKAFEEHWWSEAHPRFVAEMRIARIRAVLAPVISSSGILLHRVAEVAAMAPSSRGTNSAALTNAVVGESTTTMQLLARAHQALLELFLPPVSDSGDTQIRLLS